MTKKNATPSRWSKFFRGLLIGAVFVASWQLLACGVGQQQFLPGPYYLLTTTLPSLAKFSSDSSQSNSETLVALGVLLGAILATTGRLLVGIICGTALGILGGLLLFYPLKSSPPSRILIAVLRGIPLLALIPFFVRWVPGQTGIVLYISFAITVLLASDVYEAANNVPKNHIHQAQLMGAQRWQLLLGIILPGIISQLRAGIRTVVGFAWAFSLGAEFLKASQIDGGLGYLMFKSYNSHKMDSVLMIAICYGALGYISYRILKIIFNRFLERKPRPLT